MSISFNNFYELHVNLCMHMNCLEDYLKTIGTRQDRKYFVVTLDGNCWIIDPIKFNESFDEQKCTADGKIKTLNDIPENTTKIKIPDGVICIEAGAFNNCPNIANVTIPDSVMNIYDGIFWGYNSLTNVTIGNGVTSIGGWAFASCTRLEHIVIPSNVNSILYYAFNNCTSLKSMTIPSSVTSIGQYAFRNCTSLKYLVFNGKTLNKVKKMNNYPWGIEDESIIKAA